MERYFGNGFPAPATLEKAAHVHVFRQTEEFIEDRFPVDIRYDMKIDCEVSQNGFRNGLLGDMLRAFTPLQPKKKLRFFIANDTFPSFCDIYWKVLNRGEVAERRDEIRGGILIDQRKRQKIENTNFRGEHLVECYAVLRGVVVARDSILVPIN